jgi:amidohydrolase
MSREELALRAFEEVERELQSISKWMHEHPETAYEEFEGSRRLAGFLADNGFEVTYPAYGLETAFEANAGTTGTRVVICAEYDALPEVGHACGHNIIATSSLGAGVAVAGLTDDLGLRVTVLGTPAEEGGGGKIELVKAGDFEDAAASMLIHPGPGAPGGLADPRLLAAQRITVEFRGKEAHAAAALKPASTPWTHSFRPTTTCRHCISTSNRATGSMV